MSWFSTSTDDALVLNEEMDPVPESVLEAVFSRRTFLGMMGSAATAISLWPFKVLARDDDFIIVEVRADDKNRNSLHAIVNNYCNTATLLRYYNTEHVVDTIFKLAQFNGLRDPNVVRDGQKIKIPKVILKKGIQKAADKELKRKGLQGDSGYGPQNRWGFQSPFGSNKKPEVHLCFQETLQNPTGLRARICPFDRFTATRSNRRAHNALDIWGKIGTGLYPLKPGTVVGAGYYYLNRSGQRVKFKFWRNNGKVVKIQTDDGFTYMYLHLNHYLVKIGETVDYNTPVGELGVTGNASKANPHVHITLRKNGTIDDPLKYLGFLE